MAEEDETGDVFAIPDLWRPSRFFTDIEGFEKSSTLHLFSDLKLDEFIPSLPLPEVVEQPQIDDGFFAIPDLSFGTNEGLKTPTTSEEASPEPEQSPAKAGKTDLDIWGFPHEIEKQQAKYLSWNEFLTEKYHEPSTSYISEAGPGVFDAALADKSRPLGIGDSETPVIDSHIYATSLLALGLSRSSVLFSWNDDLNIFEPKLKPMRISGCTVEPVDSIQSTFMSCGNNTKKLQSFIDKTYNHAESPCRVALADAASTLLRTIQSRMNVSHEHVGSILQLQASFEPVKVLLSDFVVIIHKITSAESDEALLSKFYDEVQTLEYTNDQTKGVFLEVLSCVSRPFLDFSEEWLGLRSETVLSPRKNGAGKSFVKLEERFWIDEQGLEMHEPQFALDESRVPSFLSQEDAQVAFETGRSLRFLREHHSNHPLVNMDIISSTGPPSLEWEFSWHNIENIEAKARRYEEDLLHAIQNFSKSSTTPKASIESSSKELSTTWKLNVFGKLEEEMEAHILASISELSRPLQTVAAADRLSTLIDEALRGTDASDPLDAFSPPISLASSLSFSPVIAAQARIVNGTSLRLFFLAHNLRDHLNLQRQFQLLGNGVFSSRLSHALFDPELETAERQAGIARSGGIMGLRLGGRETWPPASSELRLALMGVLTESYFSTKAVAESRGGHLDRRSELPGDLSFAVREMSEEEIEKCLDPDSIEALDFLRLSYKPPPPLDAILTPMALYKYDQLFKLLLRVLRMLYVVNQLFRDATDRTSYWQGIDNTAQRFRIEAHHFITSLSSYFFDTGITATWKIFDRKLEEIETRLSSTSFDSSLTQHDGLSKLEEYHERVLDRIMTALLLRKRQQPVMKLLEEIFGLVLQFAKHSRSRALGLERKVGDDGAVGEMYARFRRKVEVFVGVCRGLSEKGGFGGKEHQRKGGVRCSASGGGLFDTDDLVVEGDNSIVELLGRLEMSGYYSAPAPAVVVGGGKGSENKRKFDSL